MIMLRLDWATRRWLALATLIVAVAASLWPADAQERQAARAVQPPVGGQPTSEGALPADWVKAFTWRNIGPANMGGRITDLSVFEADPTTYWVATASGGLLKT